MIWPHPLGPNGKKELMSEFEFAKKGCVPASDPNAKLLQVTFRNSECVVVNELNAARIRFKSMDVRQWEKLNQNINRLSDISANIKDIWRAG